ncbi:MAG: hypothetical protein GY929_12115 [Actinomycetia bacterium]|nr:hypothetical protein [Actinomycetes bacterium]
MVADEPLQSEIVLSPDGARERWTGHGPHARDQLIGMVEGLERLAGLAVPRVLATHTGDPTVVDLSWAGPTTLANIRPADAGQALSLIGAVATTVQAGHARGVRHGALEPSLVTLDPDGTPVVTGFTPNQDLLDEGTDADADSISRMAALLLGGLPRLPRSRAAHHALSALREMAQPRPHTMAELVALAAGSPPDIPGPARQGRAGIRAAVTVIGAVGVIVAAYTALSAGRRSPPGTTAAPTTTAATAAVIASPTSAPPAPPPTAPACPAIEGTGADIDGDGCLDWVTIDGTLVTSAHAVWEVGAEGDLIVLGDWNCDGMATPAALRPTTGAVFVFESWVDRTPTSIAPVEVSPGLAGLHADDPDGDGCHRLLGVDAGGTRYAITEGG